MIDTCQNFFLLISRKEMFAVSVWNSVLHFKNKTYNINIPKKMVWTQEYYIHLQSQVTGLCRWLPHSLSKRQSPKQSLRVRTPVTPMIIFNQEWIQSVSVGNMVSTETHCLMKTEYYLNLRFMCIFLFFILFHRNSVERHLHDFVP